jgi:ribosomal protein S18 acetylase RimI-like enzyme
MIIRPITKDDLPACIHMGARMHEESQYSNLAYSPEKCYAFGINSLDNDDILWVVAESEGKLVGMLGASVQDIYFAEGRAAHDYLIYVTPDRRGSSAFHRLVAEYAEWAMTRADEIFISVSNGSEETLKLFDRLGFKRMGGIFKLEK